MTYIALDLCSGAGGVTMGLRRAGVRVIGAVDNDADCVRTMRANHQKTRVLDLDLGKCSPAELRRAFSLRRGQLDILTFCTPCQSFSSMGVKNRKPRDARAALVSRIGDFVAELRPRALIMENVPHLARHRRFKNLLKRLADLGYAVEFKVVCASEAGVPQRRKRLVCIAIKGRKNLPELDLALASKGFRKLKSVRAALARVAACAINDALSEPRRPKGIVAARIRSIPKDGGSRDSLDAQLVLGCHKRLSLRGLGGSTNVYGRMQWDELAPTLTTRCTTPACGRFIHPSKMRAITLREAALLQSFPPRYRFIGSHTSIERQVGNAVPVMLATATVRYVISNLPQQHRKRS